VKNNYEKNWIKNGIDSGFCGGSLLKHFPAATDL
jgi:hypothetical protein